MSSGENINAGSPSSLSSTRHFLIVPSFNPERRHSWGNIISNISVANPNITSSITITNTDSIRWEFSFVVIRLTFEQNNEEKKKKKKKKKK